MVLPAIIGGVILIGGAWYAVDQADGKLQEIAEDTKDDLVAAGVPILDSIGDGLKEGLEFVGSGIRDFGEDLGSGLLDLGSAIAEEVGEIGQDLGAGALKLIKGAGVAVIEGAEDVVDYTWDKVAPYRVETVTALTALTIYITTGVILFKKIRGAN